MDLGMEALRGPSRLPRYVNSRKEDTLMKRSNDGLVPLKQAASAAGIPVKRLRRWVRLHKLGRPVRDESGFFLVDPKRLTRYMDYVKQLRELRDLVIEFEEE